MWTLELSNPSELAVRRMNGGASRCHQLFLGVEPLELPRAHRASTTILGHGMAGALKAGARFASSATIDVEPV